MCGTTAKAPTGSLDVANMPRARVHVQYTDLSLCLPGSILPLLFELDCSLVADVALCELAWPCLRHSLLKKAEQVLK